MKKWITFLFSLLLIRTSFACYYLSSGSGDGVIKIWDTKKMERNKN